MTRIGIIGCGGIAGHHLTVLRELPGEIDCRVTAFCDTDRAAAERRREKYGAGDELVTADCIELLDSGEVDAVLVATPHPHHPQAAIAAFERGIHVFCEKPVAVTAGDAARINEAADKSGCVYTVHFQRRHVAGYRWLKDTIAAGLLGRIHKVNITWTDWYRPRKYYERGTWRGTWAGEGGGVLMNQCPHDLDLFTWWLGLPETVDAKIWLGRFHDIEVEDEVAAVLEFPGGGVGFLNASTCDAPGVTRWDILGDDGAIFIEGVQIRALRRPGSFTEYTQTTEDIWAPAPLEEVAPRLEPYGGPQGTAGAWANFIRAVRGEEEIRMDGREGRASLELANAIVASGFLGEPVSLPVDTQEYAGILDALRRGETGRAVTRRGR